VRTRWRDAANVAAARWEVFLHAEVRGFAFASYVAALNAEEGVHRTYLDSGAEERPRGAPARHSLENSCSMSLAPSTPHSTPV
jgi:hypothetical protein